VVVTTFPSIIGGAVGIGPPAVAAVIIITNSNNNATTPAAIKLYLKNHICKEKSNVLAKHWGRVA